MKTYLIYISTIVLVLAGCNKQTDKAEPEAPVENFTLTITEEQFKSAGIATGFADTMDFTIQVQASGKLDVPPQNLIDVAAPMGGIVKYTNLLQGMKVKKGDLLVELQHPDYIQLQQDYLRSENNLLLAKQELDRQQKLALDSINSRKTLEQAQATWLTAQSEFQGLASRLQLLNLKPEKIKAEGIFPSIRLIAPMDGYVSEVNINIGRPVNTNDIMVRLVNTEHLHAELQVFEKDILRIKEGQTIQFSVTGDPRMRKAHVYLVGHDITAERTVRIHGHLDIEDPRLLPGMFLTATIETGRVQMTSVPEEAVVTYSGKSWVFVEKGKLTYELVEVQPGGNQNNYVGLTGAEFKTKVVLKGAYTLLSLLFNASDEE